MIRNIIMLLVLSGVLGVLFGSATFTAAQMRASQHLVRVTGYRVWRQACEHAAGADKHRLRWCEMAAQETPCRMARAMKI